MSDVSKTENLSTPMKQQAKPESNPATPEAAATSNNGDGISSAAGNNNNASSPQKQLNPSAKVFVPKLDDKSLTQSNSQQFNPASATNATKRSVTNNTSAPAATMNTPMQRTPSRSGGIPPPPMMGGPMGSGSFMPMMPFMPPPPPNPAAAFNNPLLNPVLLAGIPPSPMMFNPALVPSPMMFNNPPPASPMSVVNVGNASLAALRSKEPPKFACVLLVGLPASGKTTVGRDLVQGLINDKMPWAFFSGSDHMSKESGLTRPAAWDTTKEVFQALSNRLDSLMAKQSEPSDRIKGLVIDKNCRGVEDLFYLTALLRSKGLPLVGVVGLEAKDDDVLLQRMGGQEELREKLKHHRVIQARIAETARSVGIYRGIDSTKPKDAVVLAMRTMVLGCSAQPPTRSIASQTYSDGTCPMVDSFEEYCHVMSTLFSLLKPGVKGPQFPGFTEYTPFTSREMEDRKKIAVLKEEYVVRRRVDGFKHVLLHDGAKWYLIPRHMRAVFSVRGESWIGRRLKEKSCLVLDGDLVRLTKDRSKEKFVVSDVYFHSTEDEPTVNSLARATWTERQTFLKTYLCDEATSFFPPKADMIIVLQQVQEWAQALPMLDPLDYPSDGIVMQPRRAADLTYVWRPPHSVTVDLRLGPVVHQSPSAGGGTTEPATPHSGDATTPSSNGSVTTPLTTNTIPARSFAVEVYSREDKKYVLLENDTVEVRRNDAVEGCICVCGLQFEDGDNFNWTFHRVRTDVARAAYKNQVEDLLENGLISRARMVTWLQNERFAAAAPQAGALDATAGSAAPPPPPAAPTTTAKQQTTTSQLSRGAFGVALTSTPNGKASSSLMQSQAPKSPPPANNHTTTTMNATTTTGGAFSAASSASLLQKVMPNVKVQTALSGNAPNNNTQSKTNSNKPRNPKSPTTSAEPQLDNETTGATNEAKRCTECKKPKKPEDLRLDKKDQQWYCYACWAKSGTEFCADCGEFSAGHRENTRRHTTPFYCEDCWVIYNASNNNTRGEQQKDAPVATGEKKAVKPPAAKKTKKPETDDAANATPPSGEVEADGKAAAKKRRGGKKDTASSTPEVSSPVGETQDAEVPTTSTVKAE